FLAEDEGQAPLRSDNADKNLAAASDRVDVNLIINAPPAERTPQRLLEAFEQSTLAFDPEQPRIGGWQPKDFSLRCDRRHRDQSRVTSSRSAWSQSATASPEIPRKA